MTRISLYALIPYVLTSLTFSTAYFDLYALTAIITSIVNFVRRRNIAQSLFLLVFTVIALLNCGSAFSLGSKSFYPLLEEPVTLKCVVDETPAYSDDGIEFTAKMISAVHFGEDKELKGKVLVYVNGTNTTFNYGDLIEFKTELILPDEELNDGGFNYRSHLVSRGIYTTCTSEDFAVINHGTYEKINPIIYAVFKLRSTLLQKCDEYFSGDTSAFVKALILGYKNDISYKTSSDIRRAGISHIISVSGMHLSIFMVIINAILRKLQFRGNVFAIPVLNALCALFITAMTGFSPSVKRAAIMLIISNSASVFYRENDSLQSLSFAVFILLLVNPCAIYDVRLTLSAASVLGIILFSKKLTEKLGRFIKIELLRDISAVTISAQIFTAPLCVLFFNSISLLGIVTNLIILPAIPYLMSTGVAFLLMPINTVADFLSDGIWAVVNIILIIAGRVAEVPFAQVEMSFHKFLYISLLCAVIVYLMKKTITCRNFRKNIVCFSISCIAAFLIFFPPAMGNLHITVINVGQGDCTLIQFPNGKTMLVDGGGTPSSDYDIAEKIIKPYLIQNDITKIDYAVISHFHSDHAEGILNLADDFPVGCIIAPDYLKAGSAEVIQKAFDICNEFEIPMYLMGAGDEFYPDEDTSFTVYNPDDKYIYSQNDGSMVFKISAFGKSILFTGDIEYYSRHLLSQSKSDISADILKAPHHGDYSIADGEFLEAVDPDIVYACVGENNPYGHPAEESVMLYAAKGIDVFRTDLNGTIKFIIKRNSKISIS